MRKLLFLVAAVFTLPAWADCSVGQTSTPQTFDSEKITVGATAVGFTGSKVNGSSTGPSAQRVYCSVETDQIRFLVQAIPTAATGVLVAAGSYFEVCNTDIPRFFAIRVTADATLNCLYQR